MDNKTRTLKIIFTTDIHGNYFPYDFRHDHPGKGSLQRVYGFVEGLRRKNHGSTILIDGGDMLQGEPTSYYYNYIEQTNGHRVADFCNFLKYDVAVIGNHDIETGHFNFDRYTRNCHFPILGANAIRVSNGEPYFRPYTIIKKCGIRIAVIGFITPAIPHWIPKDVWKDLYFDDIKCSAKQWVEYVKDHENPDYTIGLIHSGMDNGIVTPEYKENAVRETASEVEGFDIILYGHDHSSNMEAIDNPSGQSVICVNPGSFAYNVARIKVKFSLDKNNKIVNKSTDCQLIYIGNLQNSYSDQFQRHFEKDFNKIKEFASEKIGTFTDKIDIKEAYFGSSAYIDLIHKLQINVSGAQLSLAAPLFFNATIKAGEVRISDLFNLYRFEDRLYTIMLRGSEIKNYLEMSYAYWTNQMSSEDDKLLLTEPMKNNPQRIGFKNFLFNFDSISGLVYNVDVRKAEGEKINIISMANGDKFDENKLYSVAMTAYRANGGGELLTKGAGLTKEEIEQRIVKSTNKDVRFYLMNYIKEKGTITPNNNNLWKFIPEEWVKKAKKREWEELFGYTTPNKSDDEREK